MTFWMDPAMTTEEIARELLGCLLAKKSEEGIASGWIVETEAYLGEIDAAAHSYRLKRTARLTSMYKEAGTIYVYSMHTHQMMNLVVQEAGFPEAILIRALEPHTGIELMEERRGQFGYSLTNGPGKLTKAMGINKADDGTMITEPPLILSTTDRKYPKKILVTPRIGIPNKGKWTEAMLRFTVSGNPYVSRKKGRIEEDFGWKSD